MIYQITVLILALAAPLLLLPVESFLPYPAIIEELVKFVGVMLLRSYTTRNKTLVLLSLLFGLLFATSETFLYLMNFFILGNFSSILTRIIYTSLLHMSTTGIISLGILAGKKKMSWPALFGLLIAIIIHYGYNSFAI